jgi:nucleotide-binding universal stress UspA family protein
MAIDVPARPGAYRILVAVDASWRDLTTLEPLVGLAGDLPAELLGLFIEDVNLLRLAALPIAREVTYGLGGERKLDLAGVERQLRWQAEQLRQIFASAAERARLPWSFRVVRGQLSSELVQAARDADLLVFGIPDQSRERRVLAPGGVSAVAQIERSILWLHPRATPRGPVMVLFDGTEASRQAVDSAARLARQRRRELVLLLPPPLASPGSQAREQAAEWLSSLSPQPRQVPLARADAPNLLRAVRSHGAEVLVLPGGSPMLTEQTLGDLLRSATCSVVLAR